MNKYLTLIAVALLAVVLVVVVLVNRVAIKAAGIKVTQEAAQVADRQMLDNWELFFHQALGRLAADIAAQEKGLMDLRVNLARDRRQIERDRELLQRYEGVVADFGKKVHDAGAGEVKTSGRTYTPEEAQASLRELAGAVVDQEAKVKGREANIALQEEQIKQIEGALRVAHQQLTGLKERGEEMVREKKLAELKRVSIEMSTAINGMDPNLPVTGAMLQVRDLLSRLQTHIDTQGALGDVAQSTATGRGRVLTMSEALQNLGLSEREKQVDAVINRVQAK